MHDLPAEIYINIFLYLKRIDLQTCYYICKSWRTVAMPLGWKEVTLKNRNISLVKSHLNNVGSNQYFKYSHLIKTLAFEDAEDRRDLYKFGRLKLLELFNQLPNLKVINFTVTNYLEEYLEYLLEADMQHINSIYTGSITRSAQSDLLFSAYYKFRNSITCIDLLYNRDIINFDSQQINILNSLNQFKKLKKLVIHNLNDSNLTPFQIQDNCPNLERLEFASHHPVSDSAVRNILDYNIRTYSNVISNLTYLQLKLPSLSAVYTTYFVDYFPNQLTCIYITISLQHFFNWIDIVGMELALRLMEKVGRIKETNIAFLGYEENEVRAYDENNITKYFKLLNSFRGTRQNHCTANFDEAVPETRHLVYAFKLDELDRLFVTYNLNITDLYGSITADMAVPDKTISIIGPEIFDVLDFNLLSRYGGHVYRVLNYSLLNCPRLQSLNITHSILGRTRSSLSFRHNEDEFFSDQASCAIKFLEMERIRPAKNIFDLVTTHLRNIEILSFKANDHCCKFSDLVIDLTGFKKLKRFKYISADDCFAKENTSFLIRYTNGTERHIGKCNSKSKDSDNLGLTVLCDIAVSLDFCARK
ncbi:hypothetical protein HPULCUR_011040 [Helicostylum pulchrum]|uniref:F-box domain-containing protein n=1 Tax=Helicostylum pulchrum TaxID=562976 RepID=A0ABP9YG21_9FUNG